MNSQADSSSADDAPANDDLADEISDLERAKTVQFSSAEIDAQLGKKTTMLVPVPPEATDPAALAEGGDGPMSDPNETALLENPNAIIYDDDEEPEGSDDREPEGSDDEEPEGSNAQDPEGSDDRDPEGSNSDELRYTNEDIPLEAVIAARAQAELEEESGPGSAESEDNIEAVKRDLEAMSAGQALNMSATATGLKAYESSEARAVSAELDESEENAAVEASAEADPPVGEILDDEILDDDAVEEGEVVHGLPPEPEDYHRGAVEESSERIDIDLPTPDSADFGGRLIPRAAVGHRGSDGFRDSTPGRIRRDALEEIFKRWSDLKETEAPEA